MILFNNLNLILLSLALGLSLPLIGVFVVLRKEALLSDALAHVILLGIALSLVFKVNVALGIFLFSIIAAFAIHSVKNKANLSLDAIIGVFFTTALAIASLLIPSEELLESFLGNFNKISRIDVGLSLLLAGLIIAALLLKFREFAYASFAPDLAQVDKLKVKKYELAFILILALGVAMGIKLVGTLLISALIIIPAATAKIFSFQIRAMALWSMMFGLIAVLTGLFAAKIFNLPSGPAMTLTGSVLFFAIFILHSLFKTHR